MTLRGWRLEPPITKFRGMGEWARRMKYRKFGSMDWEVSVLAFGLAGLPGLEGGRGRIDEASSMAMIRYAIDRGVNYIDLGYPYRDEVHEERMRVLASALRDGYRQKVRISSVIPARLINSPDDFDRRLDADIRRMEGSGLDFCLLGRLTRDNWPLLRGSSVPERAERAVSDGRIRGIGFSFHDHYHVLKEILDAYDGWSLCQFHYSYMDVAHDPGVSGLKLAADRGKAVVVSEALSLGRLTRGLPPAVADLWSSAANRRTLAEWGLTFVWSLPEVATVVCDMGSMDEVAEDAALADRAEPENLTVQEEVLVSRVREAYRALRPVNCASCRPCMPCPQEIDVPRIFEIYNDAFMYGDLACARSVYRNEGHDAGACTKCGSCESACARRLPVLHWLELAHRLLGCGE
jgi:predicted aldo/keto reductase-like oxidoreductase